MERIFFLIFLCTVSEGDIGKPIFVSNPLTWFEARDFCLQHHTNMYFICSQRDQDKITAAGHFTNSWIGLYQEADNNIDWRWSGGGYMTYQNWESGEPNSIKETKANMESNGKWQDNKGTQQLPFYCINVTVVEDKKTWEAAQRHCRDRETNLISMHCETDRTVAQRVIQKASITERVWIGLRYPQDSWLWVNGEPLDYQAWPQGGDQDHQCPVLKRCGAFTKEGLWENWDCNERLNFICN